MADWTRQSHYGTSYGVTSHGSSVTKRTTMHSIPDSRIDSVDLMKGVVMVLMAIDHVRVYEGVPAGRPDPAVFVTRWITHFVALGFAARLGCGAVDVAQRRAAAVSGYGTS